MSFSTLFSSPYFPFSLFIPTKHTLCSKSSLSLPYQGVFCFCLSRDNKMISRACGGFFCGIRGSSFLSPIVCNSFSFFLPTCLNGGTHRYLAKYVSLREEGFRFYPSKRSAISEVRLESLLLAWQAESRWQELWTMNSKQRHLTGFKITSSSITLSFSTPFSKERCNRGA